MSIKRRTILQSVAAAGLGGLSNLGPGLGWVHAQALPTTRLWVGTAPGGSTDTIAREIAPELGRLLGRQVIVENRSGAGGNLAADVVAKAAPDGANLLVSFTGHTINASLYKNLPFDPIADFTPLTILNTSTSVPVFHPGQPYQTLSVPLPYLLLHSVQHCIQLGRIASPFHFAAPAFQIPAILLNPKLPYPATSPMRGTA